MTLRNFWSQLFPAWSFRTAPHERRFRLHLEHLEDRTLPSVSVFFDSAAGNLSLLGDGSDDTIRQTLSSAGFLEVAVDGQQHSSDPKSAFFDQALAGANAGNLAGIRFDGGGGQDMLILGAEQLAGNLTVSADGVVRTQDVTVGGRLVIQAPTVSVGGNLRGGDVTLDAAGFVTIEAGGLLTANQIDVSADVFVNSGQLGAAPTGGKVLVSAGDVLNSGRVSADGSAGGGAVRISFTRSYVDTSPSVISADGGASPGGSMTIDGGTTGRLFISGRHESVGSVGGSIDLFGQVIELVGATVDASGEFGGGSIRIGGQPVGQVSNLPYRGWQVENLPHNAETVTVTGSTTVRADALGTGDGGRVVVWSDQETHFDSSLSARGGPASGAGGFIEVSSKGTLTYRGGADAGAAGGKAGTLLLDPKNLIISAAPTGVYPQFDLVDPHPTAGGGFGATLTVLTNGNVVVTNPNDDFGGTNAGAVYLFDG
jgi:hypothetical protein